MIMISDYVHSFYISPKLMCPVFFAWACASAGPLRASLHTRHRRENLVISVYWRAYDTKMSDRQSSEHNSLTQH